MERIANRKPLEDLKENENPWKHHSPAERFLATAVISGTTQIEGQLDPPFPKVYRVFKRAEGGSKAIDVQETTDNSPDSIS
ncbi:MAG: hypothetical protein EOP88_22065 [Verrucomicrobiaceae bacterium]|nr:MAG: hypothetical protein EOP88_22065 [Verrucomicrobiaceae bacterium]